jgi:sec-independent protein translocase protein TatA
MGLGKIELILIIILVVVVLFVGGKKLPELARGIGQAGKEIKKGFSDSKKDDDEKETKK